MNQELRVMSDNFVNTYSTLSMECLGILDQACCLSKESYPSVFNHIESLLPLRRRLFLRHLKEENPKMHKAYLKIVEEQEKADRKARSEWQREIIEKQKKREEEFQALWPETKVFETIKSFIPDLCGISMVGDLFFKRHAFKDSVIMAYQALQSSAYKCSYSAALPVFFDALKYYTKSPHDAHAIGTSNKNFFFILCETKEAQKKYIKKRKELLFKDIEDRIKDDWNCLLD